MYAYQFCIEPTEKYQNIVKLKCIGCKNLYILLPLNFIFVPKPSNFKWKSPGLKTIETYDCYSEKTIADTIDIATFLSI